MRSWQMLSQSKSLTIFPLYFFKVLIYKTLKSSKVCECFTNLETSSSKVVEEYL